MELDSAIAISAARLSWELKLPMDDSIILTTANRFDAYLWTQDSDFAGIEGVHYKEKT